MIRQHKISEKLFSQRVVATITLVALLLSVLPLSIPEIRSKNIDQHQKDQSQPFPCMNRPCGCNSADQCWKECCCFNKEEKLAWARKNGVMPPSFLTDDVEPKSIASVNRPKSSHKKKSCCLGKKKNQERIVTTLPIDNSLCGSSASCCSHKTVKRNCKKPEAKKNKRVIGIFVQKCRGYGQDWTTLPWLTLETKETIRLSPDLVDSLGLIAITKIVQSYPPALPPPQC